MRNRFGKMIFVLCAFAVAALLPYSAFSAGFAKPTVEYSADRVMTSGGNTMTSRVFSTPEKERMEFKDGGMVTIVRRDKNVTWMLMLEQKMYMEQKMSGNMAGGQKQGGDNFDKCDVKQTEKGKEDVNGFSTRKMEMTISCPGNEKFTGMVWLTKENIPIRMETKNAGTNESFRMELKNLKIGKQDPALFEIPAGFQSMAMPTMPRQ